MGSVIDTTRGRVQLATVASGGKESGVFSKGAFKITQKRSRPKFTDLTLVGGRRRVCALEGASGSQDGLSRRVIRRLRGDARGHFRSRGQHSSATIRGTVWLTEDRCDGTVISSEQGKVITSTGGQGGQGFELDPGESLVGYCSPPSRKLVVRDFCLTLLSRPALGVFGFGLITLRADSEYDLCIRGPSGAELCRRFTLNPPNANGARIGSVGCEQTEGPGEYTARWLVNGQQLGIPLPFTATIPQPFPDPSCVG